MASARLVSIRRITEEHAHRRLGYRAPRYLAVACPRRQAYQSGWQSFRLPEPRQQDTLWQAYAQALDSEPALQREVDQLETRRCRRAGKQQVSPEADIDATQ